MKGITLGCCNDNGLACAPPNPPASCNMSVLSRWNLTAKKQHQRQHQPTTTRTRAACSRMLQSSTNLNVFTFRLFQIPSKMQEWKSKLLLPWDIATHNDLIPLFTSSGLLLFAREWDINKSPYFIDNLSPPVATQVYSFLDLPFISVTAWSLMIFGRLLTIHRGPKHLKTQTILPVPPWLEGHPML